MSTAGVSFVAELAGSELLIVTNGDSAVDMLREFGFQAALLPWRDVLHDGPVPDLPLPELSEVRARFICSEGWGRLDAVRTQFRKRDQLLLTAHQFEEIVLWFEHDLYDQLQLLQVVHQLNSAKALPPLRSVFCKPHITSFDQPATWQQFEARRDLTRPQLQLAHELWTAFTRGNYRRLEEVASSRDETFPHLAEALERWLEEFPWKPHGLTRTQYKIAEVLRGRPGLDPVNLFRETQLLEEAAFLGDSSFWTYLEEMVAKKLIRVEGAGEFRAPWNYSNLSEFRKQSLVLDDSGRAIFNVPPVSVGPGSGTRYSLWRGGREITGNDPWWWDPDRRQLVRA